MCSHVAVLCETGPSSQNSAVCLHSIGLVLRFTHATTPYTCNYPLHMQLPPTHVRMHFIPSCGDLTIKVLMRITVTNYTVLSLIQSPDSLELMGYACMHACTEGKQNSRMCNTITVALTLLHRTARGRDRGRVQGTGEANDCGMCTHTLRLHHITYNAQSEQRVHAFCNKVDHCSQYIHPQNPDYVVPMEPSLLFHKGTL